MGSLNQELVVTSGSAEETIAIGRRLGERLRGGELIELISDIGGGKTTLVRGMAVGIDSHDQVQSPTFTIQRIYKGKKLDLHHFDFHRLQDPGVMQAELTESIAQNAAVVIEWSDIVADVLPAQRLKIQIRAIDEARRELVISGIGKKHSRLAAEMA